MRKRFTSLFLLLPLLAGCGVSDNGSVLNSGRTDVESIQAAFREDILAAFDVVEEEELIIANPDEPGLPKEKPAQESAETKAWRASVVERWSELGDDKGDEVCGIFFNAVIDPNSTLGDAFKSARERLISEGRNIHSLSKIRMVADNRKTIQIPTAQESSSLFICESSVVLRMANQNLSAPQTLRLSWNYYLAGQEIKWTFSFQFKTN